MIVPADPVSVSRGMACEQARLDSNSAMKNVMFRDISISLSAWNSHIIPFAYFAPESTL